MIEHDVAVCLCQVTLHTHNHHVANLQATYEFRLVT